MDALKRAYREYNRLYFNDLLRRDIKIQWVRTHKWCAECDYASGTISITEHFRGWRSVWHMALLHEMAHLATEGDGHGPRWKREMRRLARAGAFDSVW